MQVFIKKIYFFFYFYSYIFSYWDPCYNVDLMIDRVALDLLYLQTIEDLDLGWITADPHTKELLSSFEAKLQKREVSLFYFMI